jgi:hypothetical protein
LLARLASETGGRLTRQTNDLTLGVARAQRDLTCRYTLGFYLPAEVRERPQRIVVHVLREGLRALHPQLYRFRDRSERLESDVHAAFVQPSLFASDLIRGHLFLLHPRTARSWDTLIAVSFPVTFQEPGSLVELDFGAVLLSGSRVASSFNRRVSIRPRQAAAVGERSFVFLEPAELTAGDYELRIVRRHASDDAVPETATLGLTVPDVIRGEPMLVQPILGRPRSETILVRGDGPSSAGARVNRNEELAPYDVVATKGSFEPLLVQRSSEADALLARNKACLVGRANLSPATVERLVLDVGGGVPHELPSVPLELTREGKVSCQDLFEILPDETDAGDYLLDVRIDGERPAEDDRETLPYALDEGPPAEPAKPSKLPPGRRPN